MGEFRSKLTTTVQNKVNDMVEDYNNELESFIWKGEKSKDENGKYVQQSIRLVDASPEDLNKFYAHCHTMLYNPSKSKPGRLTLLKIIAEQRDRCGVELFFRYSKSKDISSFAIVDSLKTTINRADFTDEEKNNLVLGDIVEVHSDYASLPINLVIEGGLDRLGWFDKQHLTKSFILGQGIWFSEEEMKELEKLFTYEPKKRISKLKAAMKIPEDMNLEFNSYTGLSIKEMTAMLSLQAKKYKDLSTDQLIALRHKVLFNLEDKVNIHIAQWTKRMQQIKMVAESRSIKIEKISSI